ncbi:WSC domain-containing protein [Mycena haematopus]|nr:WSC domain-containing protein [Mycena haematopus]
MTVESCIAFCSAGGFSLAGVEFGSQCYCDYALQSTGALSSPTNCNQACSGNSTELCGAGNFIDVYWNGTPPPIIPQQVGTWKYLGCFSDSVSSRQLPNQQTISGGATVESCTAACKASGFSLAGLEFGQECWCGSAPPTSSLLSDNNCATACVANTTEFCGGSNKLMVYENPTGQVCFESTLPDNFNLAAVFVVPPTTGAASVPVHVDLIQTVTLVSWSILTTASGLFTSEVLTNGGLLPMSTSEPQFRTSSLAVKPGDSPIFVTTQFPPVAVGPYCTMANPNIIGPQVLALNGRSDLWALCPNSSAANRVDVVFSPIANHPHYNLTSCEAVYLTITD